MIAIAHTSWQLHRYHLHLSATIGRVQKEQVADLIPFPSHDEDEEDDDDNDDDDAEEDSLTAPTRLAVVVRLLEVVH